MLDSLRNASKSWVAYVFIGLLIVSFGIWGISDFLGAPPANEVARVGSTVIDPVDFTRQFRLEKRRAEEAGGGTRLSRTQIQELKLHDVALRNLLDKTAVEQMARSLGFVASDLATIEIMKTQLNLADASGNLDVNRLDAIARENDMTQTGLLQTIKSEIVREQMTNTMLTGLTLPKGMLAALNHVRRERRKVDYLLLDPSRAGDVKDPDQAALAKFYKDNLPAFERPEQRQITLVHISAKSLAAGVAVTEDEIKRVYDNRKSVYVVKEKRRFEQIRFKDEAAAADGAARLSRGESFETVATLQGMKPAEVKIGEAFEGDPSIPADAFKVAANVATAALKGPFGWVILRATEVTPGSVKTLDDVRTEIRDALALEKAKGRVFELSNLVEDTLGAGATMEEAVKKDPALALRVVPALTRDGKGAAGEIVDDLPADPEFMSQVFLTEQGRETSVNSDGQGGQYIVRVDKVTPKAAPPLDAIREEVLVRWRDQAVETKLRALAASLVQRGEKGESLKAIGATLGIAPLTAPDLARTSMNEIFSEQSIDKIFEAKLGGFVSGPVGNGKSFIVARFERADVNADPSEAQITPMFNERLRQSLAADIAQTFTQFARTDLGVREPDPARWKLLVDSN